MRGELCAVCRRSPPEVGVVCARCLEPIVEAPAIVPDQIQSVVDAPVAALIDPWGRPHAVDVVAELGRGLPGPGVSLLDGSISRRHAQLRATDDPARWIVHELGSANGTWVNGVAVRGEAPIGHGDVLSISHVDLIFVTHVPKKTATIDPLSVDTVRPGTQQAVVSLPPEPALPDDITQVGLPDLDIDVAEPSGGGGGIVRVERKQIRVSVIQLELVRLLIERMQSEVHAPDAVRGFIRSGELLARLSWDTSSPSEEHVKQLVRRVRRAFLGGGIDDPIESRHGLGYRLRGVPSRADWSR